MYNNNYLLILVFDKKIIKINNNYDNNLFSNSNSINDHVNFYKYIYRKLIILIKLKVILILKNSINNYLKILKIVINHYNK